jgi:nicotinate-nucleotide adenylyltransferase
MKIGLFFGSFNPVHVGHLIIANHVAENCNLDEVWLVVSPQNPFKKNQNLLNEYDRLHLINLAIGNHTKLKASDIEFNLPKPSYTIDTLVYLKEKYPKHEFSLIMGSDNLKGLPKWKNSEVIIKNYPIIVYQRPNEESIENHGAIVTFLETPLLNISSTYIRQQIKHQKSCQYLLPDAVLKYIDEMNFYK